MVQDAKGNFYGVTNGGGNVNEGVGYELSSTKGLIVLHNFTGPQTADGCLPLGTLAIDKSGNLYGATSRCGSANEGTVFKVGNTGKYTVLHNFVGGPSDGAIPSSGVIRDKAGNLYGETQFGGTNGGANGGGTIYKLSTNGVLTVLYSFPAGSEPLGGLIRDAQGYLYGITQGTSSPGYPTVWKLAP